ncbi:MAG: hypothetical protein IT306_03825 [Chloroflexi bacterium]|nr:hypothetical protein [Chloroflexota bacterium]
MPIRFDAVAPATEHAPECAICGATLGGPFGALAVLFEVVAHAYSEAAEAASPWSGDAFTAEVGPHLQLLHRTALRLRHDDQAVRASDAASLP